MVSGSPVQRLARRAVKGPLEKAGPAAAAALLLLLCAASLRRSPVSIAAAKAGAAREEEGCDLFDGKWVWDDGRPLYGSADCPFMDAGFRCAENGRPDSSYTKWRWQPARCTLPRYVGSPLLATLPSLHYRCRIFVSNQL
jgi:hypothetical protein